MITDKQGREWLFRKLYDDGWRYIVGGDDGTFVYVTKNKPFILDGMYRANGDKYRCIEIISGILPSLEACDVINIAEELGIVDWSKVEVDTPILVDETERVQVKRHFARFDGEHVYYYGNGRSSWTFGSTESISPKYVKLAEV